MSAPWSAAPSRAEPFNSWQTNFVDRLPTRWYWDIKVGALASKRMQALTNASSFLALYMDCILDHWDSVNSLAITAGLSSGSNTFRRFAVDEMVG